jgi:hypothetical protein
MVATCLICSSEEISIAFCLISWTKSVIIKSISFLISTALIPCLIAFNPCFTISVANRVDVVVPSPASFADLILTCFTKVAPRSSIGSSNSPKLLAIETPSLEILTSPDASLYITVRPPGPSVHYTAWFNFWIPDNSFSFSSVPDIDSVLFIFF